MLPDAPLERIAALTSVIGRHVVREPFPLWCRKIHDALRILPRLSRASLSSAATNDARFAITNGKTPASVTQVEQ
jgi:hypothetical protein